MENRGLTLIELLIYAGIFVLVLIFVSGILWTIILGNIKQTAYQEVQQNARFALTKINQEIKKATEVNFPPPGSSSDTLSLSRKDSHLNPTVFDVANGKLRISQGSHGPYQLTNDLVLVRNLVFRNLSYPETPGTIKIEMTVDHLNPKGRTEYAVSVDLNSTVTLLPGGAATSSPHLAQLRYRWKNDDGGPPPFISQLRYRWRNDDGGE